MESNSMHVSQLIHTTLTDLAHVQIPQASDQRDQIKRENGRMDGVAFDSWIKDVIGFHSFFYLHHEDDHLLQTSHLLF